MHIILRIDDTVTHDKPINNITTEEVILNYKELAKLVYTHH